MKDEILKIIVALKAQKIPVSKIESDLNFSNGLIGKAAKGITELGQDKFEKLEHYFKEKTSISKSPVEKTKLVVDNVGIKEKPSDEVLNKIRESNEKINKAFGEGTVMLFGDKPQTGYDVVSTGSISLDNALGIGGFPRGRMIEIYGMESTGKTTIALHVLAEAQKKGLKCLLVDAENSFDPEYAEAIGVDIEKLNYCQPLCGEEGLEVADRSISNKDADVVVVDSVAALIPKRELEGEMGDSVIGLQARLMSQACRKLVGIVAKQNAIIIFINQIRSKVGIIYGSPEVVCGGMALQFYASMRLRVSRVEQIKNGEMILGNTTKVKVVKNKCCPPMKTVEFDILYGIGIDKPSDVFNMAVEKGVIEKSGSWYSHKDNKFGQGRDMVIQLLRDNPEIMEEIESEIKSLG